MRHPQPQPFHYTVEKKDRFDGLAFYEWQVTDRMGWTLASGIVFGAKRKAIEQGTQGDR